MVENYLQIMIESLEKKEEVLRRVFSLNEEQAELLLGETMDKEVFDRTMDEKNALIEKLDALDSGFEKTYELVREEIIGHKEEHIEQLKTLQELVTHVVEQGVSIKAQEARLKKQLEMMFQREHKELNQKRISHRVAKNYNQNMKMLNFIDPQLMDRRK